VRNFSVKVLTKTEDDTCGHCDQYL